LAESCLRRQNGVGDLMGEAQLASLAGAVAAEATGASIRQNQGRLQATGSTAEQNALTSGFSIDDEEANSNEGEDECSHGWGLWECVVVSALCR